MADLARVGATVVDLSQVGGGVPDLLVGYRGRNWLLEIKRPGRRVAYTDRQVFFNAEWRGQRATVQTSEDAIAVISGRPDHGGMPHSQR